MLAAPAEKGVPLQQEIELLRAYLVVEGAQGRGRRQLHSMLDTDAAGMLVPAMLLQPLADAVAPVERGDESACLVHLTARREGNSVVLTLGAAGAPSSDAAERVRDAVERLARLRGSPGEYALRSHPEGTELTLRLSGAAPAGAAGAGQAVA
jgi:LytS/YehU family sensor histidine kinase